MCNPNPFCLIHFARRETINTTNSQTKQLRNERITRERIVQLKKERVIIPFATPHKRDAETDQASRCSSPPRIRRFNRAGAKNIIALRDDTQRETQTTPDITLQMEPKEPTRGTDTLPHDKKSQKRIILLRLSNS